MSVIWVSLRMSPLSFASPTVGGGGAKLIGPSGPGSGPSSTGCCEEEAAALSERLAAAEDANGEAPSGASAPVETGGEAIAPAAPDSELEDLFA